MTAQAGEFFIYEGIRYSMYAEPLGPYLQQLKKKPIIVAPSSACWRGYFGTWELKENKLFLIGLKLFTEGYKEVGIDFLFPGEDIVFANWFTGKISLPQGELLYYVHGGYESIFEEDIVLTFQNGILQNLNIKDNLERAVQRKREDDEYDLPF